MEYLFSLNKLFFEPKITSFRNNPVAMQLLLPNILSKNVLLRNFLCYFSLNIWNQGVKYAFIYTRLLFLIREEKRFIFKVIIMVAKMLQTSRSLYWCCIKFYFDYIFHSYVISFIIYLSYIYICIMFFSFVTYF